MFNRKSNVALETVALTSAAAGVNVQTAGPFASNTINAEPLRLPLVQAAMTTLVASGINQRIGLLEPAMHHPRAIYTASRLLPSSRMAGRCAEPSRTPT
ncbi:MAG: hypothetical protein WCA24_00035 [Thiomonas sp.]